MFLRTILLLLTCTVWYGCSHSVSAQLFEEHIQQSNTSISSLNKKIDQIAAENHDLNALLEEYKELIVQQDLQNKKLENINQQVLDLVLKYDSLNTRVDSTDYKTLLELSNLLQIYLDKKFRNSNPTGKEKE